jgi:hypothetical protein
MPLLHEIWIAIYTLTWIHTSAVRPLEDIRLNRRVAHLLALAEAADHQFLKTITGPTPPNVLIFGWYPSPHFRSTTDAWRYSWLAGSSNFGTLRGSQIRADLFYLNFDAFIEAPLQLLVI